MIAQDVAPLRLLRLSGSSSYGERDGGVVQRVWVECWTDEYSDSVPMKRFVDYVPRRSACQPRKSHADHQCRKLNWMGFRV